MCNWLAPKQGGMTQGRDNVGRTQEAPAISGKQQSGQGLSLSLKFYPHYLRLG